jgi:hypothetical protein
MNIDPSCRLPLTSKGYVWFRFLESSLKRKKEFPESILDRIKKDLHGNFQVHPTNHDCDCCLMEKGSIYRLKSPDLDCLFWQRTQTRFSVIKVVVNKQILLVNPNLYRRN